jgi:hypothetical protein
MTVRRRCVRRSAVWILVCGLICAGCSGETGRPAPDESSGIYAALEKEIFVLRCLGKGCHTGAQPAGGLNLSQSQAYSQLVGVPSQRRPERMRVAPGDPEASYLVQRLVPGGDLPMMPMLAEALSEADIERIRSWIRDGAKR